MDQAEISLPETQWDWQNTQTLIYGNFRFTADFVDVLPERCAENECYCDAGQLPSILLLAPPSPGESMTCFGIGSTRKLKKLFTDAGISSISKKTYPVLRTPDREIVWIPFLRRSDRLICSETTRRILRIRAEKTPSFN
jgi:tRNA(Ile)-lysidine synthetase-like protein